jgi:hypothetical protein
VKTTPENYSGFLPSCQPCVLACSCKTHVVKGFTSPVACAAFRRDLGATRDCENTFLRELQVKKSEELSENLLTWQAWQSFLEGEFAASPQRCDTAKSNR